MAHVGVGHVGVAHVGVGHVGVAQYVNSTEYTVWPENLTGN